MLFSSSNSSRKVFIIAKLDGLLLLVALTGFVCTHKIQAEDDCLSLHILCYECDSRFDPTCADPFGDFSPLQQQQANDNFQLADSTRQQNPVTSLSNNQSGLSVNLPSQLAPYSNSQLAHNITNLKRFPPAATCHGCCVKITSKTPEGVSYVKRTCLANLQINYFMVGLICMKESGARGKMCFCETDYCNGQQSHFHLRAHSVAFGVLTSLLVSCLIVTNF